MNVTQATFLVDPITFIVVGTLISLVMHLNKRSSLTFDGRFKRALILTTAFMVGFISLIEIPCYFDLVPALKPAFSATATCNEFMWHGYFDWPWNKPPIPSYNESWSTEWLLLNFYIQMLCGITAVYLYFLILSVFTKKK